MATNAKYWTLEDLTTKIKRDISLEEEVFISSAELIGYINEGIDSLEKIVNNLSNDYFLAMEQLSLVSGERNYSLPLSIYGDKIRGITYNTGTISCQLSRLRDWKKFSEYENLLNIGSDESPDFYFLLNNAPGDVQLVLLPTPSSSGTLNIWFTRQANRLVESSDICDIKEGHNYIMRFVKKMVYEKESHPNLGLSISDLQAEKEEFIKNMAVRQPDNQTELDMDTSFYEEMS